MAKKFLNRGCTVRGDKRTGLHDLADEHADRVAVESIDINEVDQLVELRDRLSGRRFRHRVHQRRYSEPQPRRNGAEVPTDEFVRVMVTNALSPMRAVETSGTCHRKGTSRNHVVGPGERR